MSTGRALSPERIRADAHRLGVRIPLAKDAGALFRDARFGDVRLKSRIGAAPIESASSLPDGAPSEETLRRTLRYVRGGAALVWLEAAAVSPDGRTHPRQLMPNEGNLDAFRRFADTLREEGMKANGFAPYLVIQAHHAGRYAKPRPFAARRHPESDRKLADFDGTFVSDNELKTAEEHFGSLSRLAKEAGFDAADVKCCHGYLPGELTSAFERPGEYGGCFENRIRFMRNAFAAARAHASRDFAVTARIGICDGVPRPYGFGTAENGEPEMEEPVRLLRTLYEDGLRTVSLTVGNPCFCLHMNRPFERGPYEPPEDPLVSVARGISLIGEAKRAVPGLEIWAAGISYLGRCAALAAAGAIEEGLCDGMLFGRMMIAYPDFPKEIASDGSLDPRRVCIACGRCEDRIRRAETPVCAVREASRKDAPRGSEE